MCKHPTNALIGTAEGIVCRVCGAKFTTFEEIHANAEAPAKDSAETEKPRKGRKKKDA